VLHYCLIATAFGPVGLAWSGTGVVRAQLPGADSAETAELLVAGFEAEEADPPAWLDATVQKLQRYFAGEIEDFSGTPLDLEGVPELNRTLYLEMLKLAWGETVTYGELGARVGAPGIAQAVGQAMGNNPIPIIIPCHRVLAAGNKIGGFSAPGGRRTKLRMLEMEGVFLGGHRDQLAFTF
jgi:methylated-DNA-[protein]-cysteine S-methyltransferase